MVRYDILRFVRLFYVALRYLVEDLLYEFCVQSLMLLFIKMLIGLFTNRISPKIHTHIYIYMYTHTNTYARTLLRQCFPSQWDFFQYITYYCFYLT